MGTVTWLRVPSARIIWREISGTGGDWLRDVGHEVRLPRLDHQPGDRVVEAGRGNTAGTRFSHSAPMPCMATIWISAPS